jgi:pimeloyl-ACP methyl ester carboxylesterase
MKRIISDLNPVFYGLTILFITCQSSYCQSNESTQTPKGNWISTVDWFKFVIRVTADEKGSSICFFDLPAEETWDVPVDMQFSDSSRINFDIYNIRCKYEGALSENGDTITGNFIGPEGDRIPINLVKTEKPPVRVSKRPQEPVKPYPYRSEEVSFFNKTDGITLQGTLTMPDSPGPFRAVVLISGSGPNDRDELIWGHRVFLVLADYLTRQGIAVLRYDDRGVGRSGGNYDEASFENFALDAKAAFEYLKSRPETDQDHVGFIGHSEGGAIAPLAASKSDETAFIVLMAAPGYNAIDGEEYGLISQWENNYRNNGASEDAISYKCNLLSDIFSIAKEETDIESAKDKIRESIENSEPSFLELSGEDREKIEMESIESFNIDWVFTPGFLNILRYDPQSALSNVHCPVLAVNGTKDIQMPCGNLSGIEKALKSCGNNDYTIVELKGLNHLFQTAESGQPNEYAAIEETIAPKALSFISDWIIR